MLLIIFSTHFQILIGFNVKKILETFCNFKNQKIKMIPLFFFSNFVSHIYSAQNTYPMCSRFLSFERSRWTLKIDEEKVCKVFKESIQKPMFCEVREKQKERRYICYIQKDLMLNRDGYLKKNQFIRFKGIAMELGGGGDFKRLGLNPLLPPPSRKV